MGEFPLSRSSATRPSTRRRTPRCRRAMGRRSGLLPLSTRGLNTRALRLRCAQTAANSAVSTLSYSESVCGRDACRPRTASATRNRIPQLQKWGVKGGWHPATGPSDETDPTDQQPAWNRGTPVGTGQLRTPEPVRNCDGARRLSSGAQWIPGTAPGTGSDRPVARRSTERGELI